MTKNQKPLYFIILILVVVVIALIIFVIQNQSSLKKIEAKTAISSDYVVSKLSERKDSYKNAF